METKTTIPVQFQCLWCYDRRCYTDLIIIIVDIVTIIFYFFTIIVIVIIIAPML